MVLADPRLVEAEPVEPLHQLQVAVHAGRGVFVHRMERRQEDAVTELDLGHGRPLRLLAGIVRGMVAAPQAGQGRPERVSFRYDGPMDTVLDRPWTTESFLAWEDRQEFKYEFDGQRVIPMTGGSVAHQRIVANIWLDAAGSAR